ncbi:MAG: cofC [Solirubrobacterales bacterium]|nr:cofC [Solirubrobacterales bacterium]
MKTLAVLPVKSFKAAKTRLAADLGLPQPELAAEMAEGVLRALCASSLAGVLVVTRERAVMDLADAVGAEIVEEEDLRGHSAAATLGIRRALELGAERVLLAAGDCPLLTTEEIDALLGRHSGDGVVILADRHGTGTNALLLTPPTAIPPSFGMGSRERHAELAHHRGTPWTVEDVPAFAYDVDTADDLAAVDAQR